MPTRLLVLGIDAASPDLIRRWADEGKLPTFRRLLDRGTSGLVRSVDGFFIGSTWPSFYTGLNPAGHGFYRLTQLKPGTYDFVPSLESPDGVGGTPFWTLASRSGRRVAILDVPLTRLDPELNGVQTVEWGGHDAAFGFQASPPEFEREVVSTIGPYPLPSDCDAVRQTIDDFERFVAGLELAAKKRAQFTVDVLGREPWDLLVQVFTESHCAGHQCWHLHDPTHPAHDPVVAKALGDPIERVYRAIDCAVATILERAGDVRVLLLSAHGMGNFRGAEFLLPEILFRLGVAARLPPVTLEPITMGDRLEASARAAWKKLPLPPAVAAAARQIRARLRATPSGETMPAGVGVDVEKSYCFRVQNGQPIGGIRLNLAGREPSGLLRPGAEADAFCDALSRDLRAIIDERTGAPLVSAVHRTDRLYEGPRRDVLPDLLVEWNGDVPTGTLALAGGRGARIRARSERIGTVDGTNDYGRTGEHLPTGIFVFAGPGIPVARPGKPVSVMDFHPTICRLMDLPDPRVDGVAMPDIAP